MTDNPTTRFKFSVDTVMALHPSHDLAAYAKSVEKQIMSALKDTMTPNTKIEVTISGIHAEPKR
jgi:hypothetical protein